MVYLYPLVVWCWYLDNTKDDQPSVSVAIGSRDVNKATEYKAKAKA